MLIEDSKYVIYVRIGTSARILGVHVSKVGGLTWENKIEDIISNIIDHKCFYESSHGVSTLKHLHA